MRFKITKLRGEAYNVEWGIEANKNYYLRLNL